jgi:uncharacterized protein (DUF983 family)
VPGLDPGIHRAEAVSVVAEWIAGSSPAKTNMNSPESRASTVSPYLAGLRGRCPRCGQGKLFAGFLSLARRCQRCGLDFASADSGDGPAVFVILIAGAVVLGSAVVVEALYRPPYWLHAALWLPLLLAVTLGLLRPLKGLLVAMQFHHKAGERRIDEDKS